MVLYAEPVGVEVANEGEETAFMEVGREAEWCEDMSA
jgi:hypothetical protein